MMTDVAPLLLKGYEALKNVQEKEDHWCLLLTHCLSDLCDSEHELRELVIKMGDSLASRRQIYPSPICYVVAQVELGLHKDIASFTLIGCGSTLPFGKSAMYVDMVRTEVYEYALWLKSGLAQPNLQILKLLHASRLADSGYCTRARKYCRTIAMAVATLPNIMTTISQPIRLSEELNKGKAKEPNWLGNIRHLCLRKAQGTPVAKVSSLLLTSMELQSETGDVDSGWSLDGGSVITENSIRYFSTAKLSFEDWEVDSDWSLDGGSVITENSIRYFSTAKLSFEDWEVDSDWSLDGGSLIPENSIRYISTAKLSFEDWGVDNEVQEIPVFHPSYLKFLTDPHGKRFVAKYTLGNLLGIGGFGSVYEGVRKKDGQQVAIKYIYKEASDKYITLPGESHRLPLEVALMHTVSKSSQCETVLQLLEWFDMPDHILLILERPIPCVDVCDLREILGGIIPESLAQLIILQVVKAVLHCQKQGVFHRDIKAENLLFNTRTAEVKLIDFGCGDLWQDTPYRKYAGTPYFWPPEWLLSREYYAEPATVWSIGILLFNLVCGKMPFKNPFAILAGILDFRPDLSKECCHLIKWCLEQDQTKRPSLMQISEHKWFTEDQV